MLVNLHYFLLQMRQVSSFVEQYIAVSISARNTGFPPVVHSTTETSRKILGFISMEANSWNTDDTQKKVYNHKTEQTQAKAQYIIQIESSLFFFTVMFSKWESQGQRIHALKLHTNCCTLYVSYFF